MPSDRQRYLVELRLNFQGLAESAKRAQAIIANVDTGGKRAFRPERYLSRYSLGVIEARRYRKLNPR